MNDQEKVAELRAFEDASIAYTVANNRGVSVERCKRAYHRAAARMLEVLLGRKPTEDELKALTER